MTIDITRKQACELIRSYVGKEETITDEDFRKITFAVNNDLQVRDFVLGLPAYYDMQQVIDFLCYMAAKTDIGEDIPFITLGGAFAYEVGAVEEFYKHLGYVAVHGPDYPLGKVLIRAANSRLPGRILTEMRKELHAKVMQVCYQTDPDYVIKEGDFNNGKYLSSLSNLSSSSEDSGRETSGETESGSTTDTQSESGSN